jgi:hypothetical protein
VADSTICQVADTNEFRMFSSLELLPTVRTRPITSLANVRGDLRRAPTHKSLGQPSWKRLLYAGNTPIQRHLKIKGEANPFDPQWRSYFAQRAEGSRVRQTVADNRLSTPEGLHMA